MHYNQRARVPATDPLHPCDDHNEGPSGYTAWHDWASRMGRTHMQLRCGGCDLYKIWIRK
jgi:hypothetical protein